MINIDKFSKIRGGGGGFKNPKNNQNKKISKKSAFSLIELSIVLIIIGLLVAGVTGGKSLIDSARQRAFINELNNYKQAVYAFKTAKDRYPGDLDNNGILGVCTRCSDQNEVYTSSSFSEPYNVTPVPNPNSAPFIDLYLEKIIDFKPVPGDNSAGKGYPYSKIFRNFNYDFTTFLTIDLYENHWFHNIKSMSAYIYAKSNKRYNPKIFKKLDVKFDDGAYNNGNIRSACTDSSGNGLGDNSYDSAMSGNGYCDRFIYNIGV